MLRFLVDFSFNLDPLLTFSYSQKFYGTALKNRYRISTTFSLDLLFSEGLSMKKTSPRSYYRYESLHRYAQQLGFGTIHQKFDKNTGLNAIIAIHDTTLGPALGGCRLYPYRSVSTALKDVLGLAHMMTLKSAFSDMPHGGAKSVLIKPKQIADRAAYFRAFGDFVHDLNGRYITAIDVGTSTDDMDIIAERTPYVIGAAKTHRNERDPSPSTALGVLHGIEAAVHFKLNRADLSGIHVAIQGAGHVGYYLAKLLHQRGARLTMCDVNQAALQRVIDEFNANIVAPEAIYAVKCDIFAPCAMGGILNSETIHLITAPIIAGSANTQLAHHLFGKILHEKGVLYAPDFAINAGGLISAAIDYTYRDAAMADAKIAKMYDNMVNFY
jgi:leucine dehydrogenase